MLIVILEGTPELTYTPGKDKSEMRVTLAAGDSIMIPEGSRFGMWNHATVPSAHVTLEFHAS